MGSTNEQLNTIIHAMQGQLEAEEVDVPMLPEVAGNVVSLTQNPDSDAADLAKLIQADQTLAAHVMRVANSAAYSPNASIVSLQQALARLGMQTITEIALAASINSTLFHTPGFEDYVNHVIKCSLASALWAKETARACRKNVEAAFLAALLNDIGRPLAVQLALVEAKKTGTSLTREDILEIEKATKTAISIKVVEAWEMPNAVKDVIRYFNCYQQEHPNQQQTMMVVAGSLLGRHFYGNSTFESIPDKQALLEDPVFADINLYHDEIEKLLEREQAVKTAMEAMDA